MTRVITLVLAIFLTAALADSTVWTGKALGYKGQAAELWVGLDGFNDLETAVQVGAIEPNGRFRFELPNTLPDEVLTRPDVREDCGDITAGLRIAALSSVIVKDNQGIVGEMIHTNHLVTFEDVASGNELLPTKITAWFYANRKGMIKEDCEDENVRQNSDVTFQKGWNVVTAYYRLEGETTIIRIRNGYTEGLQRWFFAPQQPEPEAP